MGGTTCAASPTRATRLRAATLRHETRQREDAARPDLADGPEQTLESRFEPRAKSGVVECCEPRAIAGRSTQTRLEDVAGRRDDGQWTGGAMELRRYAVVRPLMHERAGERALLVGPLARSDARGGPAKGLAAVGADDKACAQARAIRETQLGRRGSDVETVERTDSRTVIASLSAAWRRNACVRTTLGMLHPKA